MAVGRVTKVAVEALDESATDPFLWDDVLKGFGVRVARSGTRSYLVQYRVHGGRSGRTHRITIGKHGSPWTAETARQHAKTILSQVGVGLDPAQERREYRASMTIDQLCDLYVREGMTTKKASTIASDVGRIKRHIRPLLGRRKLIDLKPGLIRDFVAAVARGETAVDERTGPRGRAIVTGGRGVATRTLRLLGGMLTFAMSRDLLEVNPTRGVKAFADRKNERFLSIEELHRLGEILDQMEVEGHNSAAINILRLLTLTGARRGEIEKLRWLEVDLDNGRLNLADSKTGKRSIVLNSAAIELLRMQRTVMHGSTYVFPSEKGLGHFTGTPKIWRVVRSRLGQSELRIHDLRHSFASLAIAQGTPLFMVSKLLGHASQVTTQRYAHLADDPLKTAAEAIGFAIKKENQ